MTDTAPAVTDVRYEQADLRIGGVGLTVATAGRGGGLAPVVFLHGFGSTKEDYLDFAGRPAFTGRPFLAYDAPGCGETRCDDLPGISIPSGLSEGLPVGLQLVGPAFSENRILQAAHALEQSIGFDPVPPALRGAAT